MAIIRFIKDVFLNFLFPQNNVYSSCELIKPESLVHIMHPHESSTPIPTTSLFKYRDRDVQSLIKGLKYHGYKKSAEIFGNYIGEYLLEELSEEELLGTFNAPMIIPVPITQSKRIKRGYNQSVLLAKEAAKKLRQFSTIEIAYDVLKRIGIAVSQTETEDKEERAQNVKHQFIVTARAKIKGRNILLIDDVVTTGATLKAASDALISAGAKEVRAIVVAH